MQRATWHTCFLSVSPNAAIVLRCRESAAGDALKAFIAERKQQLRKGDEEALQKLAASADGGPRKAEDFGKVLKAPQGVQDPKDANDAMPKASADCATGEI